MNILTCEKIKWGSFRMYGPTGAAVYHIHLTAAEVQLWIEHRFIHFVLIGPSITQYILGDCNRESRGHDRESAWGVCWIRNCHLYWPTVLTTAGEQKAAIQERTPVETGTELAHRHGRRFAWTSGGVCRVLFLKRGRSALWRGRVWLHCLECYWGVR